MLLYLLEVMRHPGRTRMPLLLGGVVTAALALGAGGGYAGPETVRMRPLTNSDLTSLHVRARHAGALYDDVTSYIDGSVQPLARALLHQRNDPVLARRVAVALVHQSNDLKLNPRLLLGMLLVENPTVNPHARSSAGARGLMQVMPHHMGEWRCGRDLYDVETNICYGAHIFRDNLTDAGGNVAGALLRYNGCVRGTNTPDCRSYPDWVLSRAARARTHAPSAAGEP
jgi:soluble lytic murein transglycosylase-like protein